jgi:hypothetical protein
MGSIPGRDRIFMFCLHIVLKINIYGNFCGSSRVSISETTKRILMKFGIGDLNEKLLSKFNLVFIN